MSRTYATTYRHFEHMAVFEFTAEECRGIALALGFHDKGAEELTTAADELDRLNGVWDDDDLTTPPPTPSATNPSEEGAR